MIIDTHLHQSLHSADSKMNIEEGLSLAKERGLDAICVTDHDNIGLREKARELSESSGILVIVGVEIYTLDGDLLCYGLDELPKERMSAQATIDYVNARGGACIAAHPYRKNNRGLGDLLLDIKGLAAIEGYNGRTSVENNLKSVALAKDLNIAISAGSDAHTVDEVGRYVTRFEREIIDEKSFIKELKAGRFSADILEEYVLDKGIA